MAIERAFGSLRGFAVKATLQLIQRGGRENAVGNQPRAHSGDGIAECVGLALGTPEIATE